MKTLLDDPGEVLPFLRFQGCPTLTIVLNQSQILIPYSFVIGASMDSDGTVLIIQLHEKEVAISGKGLETIWTELQIHNVRQIHCGSSNVCQVDEITIKSG